MYSSRLIASIFGARARSYSLAGGHGQEVVCVLSVWANISFRQEIGLRLNETFFHVPVGLSIRTRYSCRLYVDRSRRYDYGNDTEKIAINSHREHLDWLPSAGSICSQS